MKEVIVKLIRAQTGLSIKEVEALVEIPPQDSFGDYSFACFRLPKIFSEKGHPVGANKNPIAVAEDLCKAFRKKLPKEISGVESKGAYVNFFIDKGYLVRRVLENVKSKGFGRMDIGKGKKFCIEFSQPNTHKAFHVGHIRGTCLGESLSRIFEAVGFRVTRMNYSGDSGMHIAKWIWCYQKYHGDEKLNDDENWIAGIYVDAVRRLAENEDLQKEVDLINKMIETREDKEINELWKKSRDFSIKSWDRIYLELNTKFDKHYFESEFEEEAREISIDLVKKRIARKDDAVFMDLKKYNLGIWVLLRRDGTVLYSAKDLALAKKKVKDFSSEGYLVIIGDEQKMHFEQLVKTLELMGLSWSKDYSFLTFGMVRFPEGKMSSRTGQNVLYSDFSSKVKEIALDGLKKRDDFRRDAEKRALKIAISAIKYSMLKQDPKRTMIFDPNNDVSFEGDTGPYLLYSYARANSILKKVKGCKAVKIIDLKESEIRLLKKINSFEEVIGRAYEGLSPNLIANYSFELAQNFNEFYHNCPVIGSVEEGFRLRLVEAFKITLGKALELLGIGVLEEM